VRRSALWTVVTLPSALLAAPALGVSFTLRNLGVVAREGPRAAFVGALNLPFDLLTNTLGFLAFAGFYPLFAGGAEHPGVGLRSGSLIFVGGPLGAAVSRIASGFTPTSTIFISRRAWNRLSPDRRDRLINHELWHARRQFLRYSGWLFWPAYLASNLIWGTQRRNPFESGRRGAYRNVDDLWDLGYRESGDYLECSDPYWRRRV
jgi:hypothetical protein